jgi:hypothetical protein
MKCWTLKKENKARWTFKMKNDVIWNTICICYVLFGRWNKSRLYDIYAFDMNFLDSGNGNKNRFYHFTDYISSDVKYIKKSCMSKDLCFKTK